MFARLFAVGLSAALLAPVTAQEPGPPPDDPVAKAFEKLKSLAGQWDIMDASKGAPKGKVTYRLTGGGSAVAETLFAGTPMEMLSVYHRDGKDLVMTHYCCAGNQPRFRARIDPKTGDLVLDFAGGANLNAAKDMHIHGGRIRFVGPDEIRSEWDFFVDGKKAGAHNLTLKRGK